MIVIRPINQKDFKSLWDIANKTGPGFSTLQPDKKLVTHRFERSLVSFADPENTQHKLFSFLLEDTSNGNVLGTAAIETDTKLQDPCYHFHIHTFVHASKQFETFSQIRTMTLCNDLTKSSKLCTLYLAPEYRKISGLGRFLSKSRFLFIAKFLNMFHQTMIAEMRGYCDENNIFPFWEAVGRKFIPKNFAQADKIFTYYRYALAEVMPRHALYIDLLPQAAQDAIGQVHFEARPAVKLLTKEGFSYRNCVCPSDGGMILEAETRHIYAIKKNQTFSASIQKNIPQTNQTYLVSNDQFIHFRCILSTAGPITDQFPLTDEQADALHLNHGDTVRVINQFPVNKEEVE